MRIDHVDFENSLDATTESLRHYADKFIKYAFFSAKGREAIARFIGDTISWNFYAEKDHSFTTQYVPSNVGDQAQTRSFEGVGWHCLLDQWEKDDVHTFEKACHFLVEETSAKIDALLKTHFIVAVTVSCFFEQENREDYGWYTTIYAQPRDEE